MSAKYLRTMADRMHERKKHANANRNLCIIAPGRKPPMETGLCTNAGLATAALTIVLFAVWFFAG